MQHRSEKETLGNVGNFNDAVKTAYPNVINFGIFVINKVSTKVTSVKITIMYFILFYFYRFNILLNGNILLLPNNSTIKLNESYCTCKRRKFQYRRTVGRALHFTSRGRGSNPAVTNNV